MPSLDNNTKAFLALVRAGLWETEARLSQFDGFVYSRVLSLAEEQAVVGIVAAGLEHIVDFRVPKKDLLQFVGLTLQLEQQNLAMNRFIGMLIDNLRTAGLYTLLLKGQEVAQCYERPLWRTSGDVDLYLSYRNYQKAKEFLVPLASKVGSEDKKRLHIGMTIASWVVELHGNMYTELSKRINRGLDELHHRVFHEEEVRSWDNNGVTVFLPSPDNDILIVFTHILQHFFIEGVGLRQICDWCRLLWTYRHDINHRLLEGRLRKMGLMSEWKVFGALAVDTLGMPIDAMPFYDARFRSKSEKVLQRVLNSGNFGHNNDLSYRAKYTGLTYKMLAIWRRLIDFTSLVPVFPVDVPRFFVTYTLNKV